MCHHQKKIWHSRLTTINMKIQVLFNSLKTKREALDKLINVIIFITIPFSISAQSYYSQINPEYSFVENNASINPYTFIFSKNVPIKDPGFFNQSYIVNNKIKKITIRRYEDAEKTCIPDSIIHDFEYSLTYDQEGRLIYSYTIYPCSKIQDTNDVIIINYNLAQSGTIQYSHIYYPYISFMGEFERLKRDTINYFVCLNEKGKPEEVVRMKGDLILGIKTFQWRNDQLQFVYTGNWGGKFEFNVKTGYTYLYSFPSYKSIDSLFRLYKKLGRHGDGTVRIIKNGKLDKSFNIYSDGDADSDEEYIYDNIGRLIKIDYHWKGFNGQKGNNHIDITYNEKNNIDKTTVNVGGSHYKSYFLYDEKTDLLIRISTNSFHSSKDKWIFNYEFY